MRQLQCQVAQFSWCDFNGMLKYYPNMRFLCNRLSIVLDSLDEDYDGEPTEVATCGFGELNRRLCGGGYIGDHGKYTPRTGQLKQVEPEGNDETDL